MNVTISFPDDFVARFGPEADLGRRALEALALEEHRAGRLTAGELQSVLGLATSDELDAFLRARGILQGNGTGNRGRERESLPPASDDERTAAQELVERFRAFRAGKTLGGLSIKELIAEGRR